MRSIAARCADAISLSAAICSAERTLFGLVSVLAGALTLAEVVLLFSGVLSRYGLQAPLAWSDELSGILFLWLSMLGAVVALRRRQHLAMTAIAARVPPRYAALAESVAQTGAMLFLILMLVPAFDYAVQQLPVQTPALLLSTMWQTAALPVGIGLMLLQLLIQVLQGPDLRWRLGTLAATAVLGGILLVTGPVLAPLGNLNLPIFFVLVLAAGVFTGVPIAFAFGLATFAYLSLTSDIPLSVVIDRMNDGMTNIVLLAVPLFILLGALIEMNGMARAMLRFLANLIGHVRGGLSYVLLGAIYLISGIAGSKAADMAAVVPVLFPEMRARGEDDGELVALLAAAGAMSETIPPSLVLITIGTVTGVSIAALFTAGLLPGLVLALALALLVHWRARRRSDRPRSFVGWPVVLRSLGAAFPALALPLIIRVAVVEGIATATEVSTLGIAYALVVGVPVYRRLDWRRLGPALVETAALSGAILLIIGAATAMSWSLTQSGFSQQLSAAMAQLPGGSWSFMLASILAFIVLGSVLEGIPAVLLFGPLLFPIAGQLGISEVHYAIVVILAMGIGLFAPPFGVGYYTACAIARVDPRVGMRPILGYLAALFAGLIVIAVIPWLSTGFL